MTPNSGRGLLKGNSVEYKIIGARAVDQEFIYDFSIPKPGFGDLGLLPLDSDRISDQICGPQTPRDLCSEAVFEENLFLQLCLT